MTHEERLAKLDHLHGELFNLANDFAKNGDGDFAGSLHHTANLVAEVEQQALGNEPVTSMLEIIMPSYTTIRNCELMEAMKNW